MTFFLTVLISIITLFVPGFFFFRILSSNYALNAVLAPVFSFVCYLAIPIVFDLCSMGTSWLAIFSLSAGIGLAFFALGVMLQRKKQILPPLDNSVIREKHDWPILLLYVVVSTAFMTLVFVRGFGDLDSFNQQFDNYTHLNLVRSYLESNQFSKMNALYTDYSSPYYTSTPTSYPPMWHIVCALIASGSGSSPALASNAFNLVICSFLFPSGVFLFLKSTMRDKGAVTAGALVATAFTAFPSGFIDWGPLSPNLLSLSLVPLLASLFAMVLRDRTPLASKISVAPLIVCLLGIMALTQPNAVFCAGIVIVALIIGKIVNANIFNDDGNAKRTIKKAALIALVVTLSVFAWILFLMAPFMQGVLEVEWAVFSTYSEALADWATFGMTERIAPQPLMGIIVLIGLAAALRSKSTSWIPLPFIVTSLLYLIAMPSEGFLRHALAGFWYTDPYRVAALVAISAIPLAALGLYSIYSVLAKLMSKLAKRQHAVAKKVIASVASIILLLAVYFPIYIPTYANPDTGFGSLVLDIRKQSSLVYTAEERAFVQIAQEYIDDDKLILNDPFDGSGYAYASDGMKVAIPFYLQYDPKESESPTALTREHLDDYTTREDVRKVLIDTNAGYLLLLDAPQADSDQSREWNKSETQDLSNMPSDQTMRGWEGLYGIDGSTPGFELLLSEGDMRLYRLTEL